MEDHLYFLLNSNISLESSTFVETWIYKWRSLEKYLRAVYLYNHLSHFCFQMKCFGPVVMLNCKNSRIIFTYQNDFESWILNVLGNWIVCTKFWNTKLLYYIWKKIIQILFCIRLRCEHLFIFNQIYFLSGYLTVRE